MNAYSESDVPVAEGEIVETTIEAIGGKGDGIAKVKGFVLFVPGVSKGDHVKLKVNKVLKSAGFAEVVEKIEQSKKTKTKELEIDKTIPDTEDFGSEIDDFEP